MILLLFDDFGKVGVFLSYARQDLSWFVHLFEHFANESKLRRPTPRQFLVFTENCQRSHLWLLNHQTKDSKDHQTKDSKDHQTKDSKDHQTKDSKGKACLPFPSFFRGKLAVKLRECTCLKMCTIPMTPKKKNKFKLHTGLDTPGAPQWNAGMQKRNKKSSIHHYLKG